MSAGEREGKEQVADILKQTKSCQNSDVMQVFDAVVNCDTISDQGVDSHKHVPHEHTLDKNGSLYDPAGTES